MRFLLFLVCCSLSWHAFAGDEHLRQTLLDLLGEGAHEIVIDDRRVSFSLIDGAIENLTIDGEPGSIEDLDTYLPRLLEITREREQLARLQEELIALRAAHETTLEVAQAQREEIERARARALEAGERASVRREDMARLEREMARVRASMADRVSEMEHAREQLEVERRMLERERAILARERESFTTLRDRLIEDGLIEEGGEYSIYIDTRQGVMTVNGEQLSAEQYHRYVALMEEAIGKPLEGTVRFESH